MEERVNKKKKINVFSKFKKIIINIFKSYPITTILVILLMCATACLTNTEFFVSQHNKIALMKITNFLLYSSIGTLFIESIVINKKNKILKYIALLIIVGISVLFSNVGKFYDNVKLYNVILRFSYVYIISLILLSIYFNFKKSELDFNKYFLRVFTNLLKTSVISIILASGLALIVEIFSYLVLEKLVGTELFMLEIILPGSLFVLLSIKSISDVKEESGEFIKKVFIYLILPLVIISYVVIYMYLCKILLLRVIPSNEIYRIILGLFIASYIVIRINNNYKDNKFVLQTIKALSWIFIPLILLQIYSIGIRTMEYGVTPLRYIAIMVIVIEIISIILEKLKKGKDTQNIIFALILVSLISIIVPVINMFNVSATSQYHIIKTYLLYYLYYDEESPKELEKAYNAYKTLKNDKQYNYYIFEKLSVEEINKVLKYEGKEYTSYQYNNSISSNIKTVYFYDDDINLDITKYSKMENVTTLKLSDEQLKENELENLEFTNSKHNQTINLNVKEKVNSYLDVEDLNMEEEVRNKIENNRLLNIDDNNDLYINTINLCYDSNTKEINSINITGILFEKIK